MCVLLTLSTASHHGEGEWLVGEGEGLVGEGEGQDDHHVGEGQDDHHVGEG